MIIGTKYYCFFKFNGSWSQLILNNDPNIGTIGVGSVTLMAMVI